MARSYVKKGYKTSYPAMKKGGKVADMTKSCMKKGGMVKKKSETK